MRKLAIGFFLLCIWHMAIGDSPAQAFGAGPTTASSPASAPAGPTAAATTGPSKGAAARKVAAEPLVIVTVLGILLVLAALTVWAMHWGRRLREHDRLIWSNRPVGPDGKASPDPWLISGQRLTPPPPDADEQERP